MLSGVKFIPRDQVQDDNLDSVSKDRKKSDSRRKKDKRKGKSSRNISSDEDELDKIKKGSRKKKWYSSDESSSSYTTESESDRDDKKGRRKGKKKKGDGSSDYSGERSKRKTRSRSGKKEYTSEEGSSSSDGSDGSLGRQGKHRKSRTKDGSRENKIKGEATDMAANSTSEKDIARKEMGLDWMLRSESKRPTVSETKEILPEEVPVEEVVEVSTSKTEKHGHRTVLPFYLRQRISGIVLIKQWIRWNHWRKDQIIRSRVLSSFRARRSTCHHSSLH
ncbi:cylicin-2-like isoform X1 [Trifolium pratense]|uniref:Uncharacterized protein n=1 Tax=Trifolium pratense TaxID=57577 RepID=A0ACB0IHS4_TRIPR|nr:cylicin-2-like isoform X1 [Trifolium pratense]CAJ2630557.1 unnamed protein product [Trifolium pratense]